MEIIKKLKVLREIIYDRVPPSSNKEGYLMYIDEIINDVAELYKRKERQ